MQAAVLYALNEIQTAKFSREIAHRVDKNVISTIAISGKNLNITALWLCKQINDVLTLQLNYLNATRFERILNSFE